MLKDLLSQQALRGWISPTGSDDTQQPVSRGYTVQGEAPTVESGPRALQMLDDAELARLGLSRGVLALRTEGNDYA